MALIQVREMNMALALVKLMFYQVPRQERTSSCQRGIGIENTMKHARGWGGN